MKYILALLCIFFAVSAQAQKNKPTKTQAAPVSAVTEAQTIRIKKGDIFKYALNVDSKQSVSAMGMEQTTSTGSDMKILLTANDVTPTSSTLEMKYQSAKVSMKGMAMAGMPDTTFSINNLESLTDVMTVLPNGTITNHKIKSSESTSMQDQLVKQIAGNSSLMRTLLVEFPDKPLTAGMEWKKNTHDTTLKGEKGSVITNTTMKMLYAGTIDTMGYKCGKIEFKSEKMNTTGSLNQMGMEMSVEGDGIINGTCYYEISTGMPVCVKTFTQMDQRMSMSGQQEMVIPVSVDMTSILTRTK